MIKKYEKKLTEAYNEITFVSESALLSRMNWWTVEYGLIKDKNKVKIFGAGLLSSVAESENSLQSNVKKIPLNLNCVKYKYDITEQQPQLFITPSYKYLTKYLKQLSEKMSYKVGGLSSIKNAIKCNSLCTIKFKSKIEISGIVDNYISYKNKIIFIKLFGPSQISYNKEQINGHGPDFHCNGYSSPIGKIIKYNKPINKLNKTEIENLNIKKNQTINLDFEGGISLSGTIIKLYKKKSKIILISIKGCQVLKNKIKLFKPEWGQFDLICGDEIISVYNGPSDSNNYYKKIISKIDKNKYQRYNNSKINKIDTLESYFKKLNKLKFHLNKKEKIKLLYFDFKEKNHTDWLFKYEVLYLLNKEKDTWIKKIYKDLKIKASKNNDLGRAINRGLELINE